MKKILLILVITATTATVYCQSSRRTTSTNTSTTSNRSSVNRDASTPGRNSANRDAYASNRSSASRDTYTSNRSANRSASVTRTSRTNTATPRRNHHVSANRHSTTYKTTHHSYKHYPVRRTNAPRYEYRRPVNVSVVWTADLHRHYVKMYPTHRHWHYRYGHRISSIPAYDADYHIGEVKNVYGRISDVYYIPETDEFILGIGPRYPYQYFTVVVPGYIARRHAHRPVRYFQDRYINVTGLITHYEGNPEIVVKRNSQIHAY